MRKRIAVYIGKAKVKSIVVSCVRCSKRVFNEMLSAALDQADENLDLITIERPAKDAEIDESILEKYIQKSLYLKSFGVGNLIGGT